MTTTPDPIACEWFALCDHESAGVAPHPVLNFVPICTRCAERFDLDVIPWSQVECVPDGELGKVLR